MRLFVIVSLIASVLLVACGGNQPPSPEAQTNPMQAPETVPDDQVENAEPTDDPNIVIVTQDTNLSLTQDFALEVPLPGTLVASETEDPNVALVFDSIFFTRTGGPEGSERIQVELFQDGRMIFNGETTLIPIETILEIDLMLDEMNFFGLQNNMMGPLVEGTEYQYGLIVNRGPDTLAITSTDGFMPTEYEQLLGTILNLALQS